MSAPWREEPGRTEADRIAELGTEEQVAAYRALHELLEATLNESN